MKVIISRALPEPGGALLAPLARRGFELKVLEQGRPTPAWLLRRESRTATALLSMVNDRVDAALLDAAPDLRVVSNFGVGTNNIDVSRATELGVVVSNTPGVLDDATADCAWALLLGLARRVVWGDAHTRAGRYRGWGPLEAMGSDVSGQVLGIVGLGRIGQAVGRRAVPFGMRLLYTQRHRAEAALERDLGATHVPLARLLAQSDFVSLHCPYTPATHHLIDARALALMQPTAFLINTSRGPVLDENALVAALGEGRIAGAGLDVYEREPRLARGLAACSSALLLPHVGSATPRTRSAMARLSAVGLVQALEGRRPDHCVNPEVFDSPRLRMVAAGAGPAPYHEATSRSAASHDDEGGARNGR